MKAATVAMRAAILCYRYALSPVLPGVCRFQPSCSQYALEAVSRFGARKGGWLTLKRLARCHPWGGSGYDPVPPETGMRGESRFAGSGSPAALSDAARGRIENDFSEDGTRSFMIDNKNLYP